MEQWCYNCDGMSHIGTECFSKKKGPVFSLKNQRGHRSFQKEEKSRDTWQRGRWQWEGRSPVIPQHRRSCHTNRKEQDQRYHHHESESAHRLWRKERSQFDIDTNTTLRKFRASVDIEGIPMTIHVVSGKFSAYDLLLDLNFVCIVRYEIKENEFVLSRKKMSRKNES